MKQSKCYLVMGTLIGLMCSQFGYAMNLEEKKAYFQSKYPSGVLKASQGFMSIRLKDPLAISGSDESSINIIELARSFILSESEAFDISTEDQLVMSSFSLNDDSASQFVQFSLQINGFNLDKWYVNIKLNENRELTSIAARTWLPSSDIRSCAESNSNISKDDVAKIILNDLTTDLSQCVASCSDLTEVLNSYNEGKSVDVASAISHRAPHCIYRVENIYLYEISSKDGEVLTKESSRRD